VSQATPELTLAVNQFVQQAIHSVMGASNPLIGALGGWCFSRGDTGLIGVARAEWWGELG
jgi:hypothetical protein